MHIYIYIYFILYNRVDVETCDVPFVKYVDKQRFKKKGCVQMYVFDVLNFNQ